MAFDPNEYMSAPAVPESDEELRRREQEQQAAQPRREEGGFNPDSYLASPIPREEEQSTSISTAPADLAVGVPTALYQFAGEHPKTTALATDIALAALPQTNIPLLKQAQQVAKAPWKIAQGAVDAANTFTESRNIQSLSQLEHIANQYIKRGEAVPADIQRTLSAMHNKVAGPMPATAPVTGPAVPSAPMAQVAEAAPRVAAVAPESIPAQMQRFAAQKVLGPLAEGAQAILNHPIVNNPVTRFVASKPVQGAMLALHSSDLGPPVPTRGVYKGMEINPNTGRTWTPQELAAINGK